MQPVSITETQKFLPSIINKLRIKVYKEKYEVTIGREQYRRMETLGYFGAIIEVIPKKISGWEWFKFGFFTVVFTVGTGLFVSKYYK